MSKKFLTHVDLVQNELQNAVIQNLATAPGTPKPGQVYYNTATNKIMWRNNSAWVDPLDRNNHSGTQAWSTITGTPTTLAGYGISDGQASNANLTAISGLGTNGIYVRTGTGTAAIRTLASGTAAATWSNADGSSGNPTINIADATTSVSGLMSGGDKTKLNGIAANATANATDAQLRDRSTHTGTQLANTISNFDTQVRTSRLDQMSAPTASVSMGNQLVTNVATPVAGTDAANKAYVDSLVNGTDWKQSVRAATTANITLSGLQTIDGISIAANERVLVKNQTDKKTNGIYSAASGAWTRTTDADANAEVTAGLAVMVSEGTTLGDTQWVLATNDPITIGTSVLDFVQIGAATSYAAGTGIAILGNVVSVDTTVVARKASASVGDGTNTSFAVTHNLSTLDVIVQVYDNATAETVECDVTRSSASQVTVAFAVAPAANAYRVVVTG